MRELLLLVLLVALPEAATLDLAIVGAGPVGTSAALRAAELGKSVALIDAPEFSGALSAADGEDLSDGTEDSSESSDTDAGGKYTSFHGGGKFALLSLEDEDLEEDDQM